MYLVKSLSRDKGSGRYTQCISTRALVPREGLYQIHGQSLNTHRGKHRSGGAQIDLYYKRRCGTLPLEYGLRLYVRDGFLSCNIMGVALMI